MVKIIGGEQLFHGGFFYENYVAWMTSLKATDELSFVDFCIPSNDPRDIGRVATAIAEKGGVGYQGSVLEISEPERIWMKEAVGRETKFVPVGMKEVAAKLPLFGRVV